MGIWPIRQWALLLKGRRSISKRAKLTEWRLLVLKRISFRWMCKCSKLLINLSAIVRSNVTSILTLMPRRKIWTYWTRLVLPMNSWREPSNILSSSTSPTVNVRIISGIVRSVIASFALLAEVRIIWCWVGRWVKVFISMWISKSDVKRAIMVLARSCGLRMKSFQTWMKLNLSTLIRWWEIYRRHRNIQSIAPCLVMMSKCWLNRRFRLILNVCLISCV